MYNVSIHNVVSLYACLHQYCQCHHAQTHEYIDEESPDHPKP